LSLDNYMELGAAQISSGVRAGELAPSDMVMASFKRATDVGAGPERLNIVLYSAEEASLEEARDLRSRVQGAADVGVLAGVPVAIKDNIASLGLPTTCASKILKGYVSPYEATAD
jgi:aspartyl-tRNA(Asn)/glutamyl-tRNA(Gln) amidotransferase subunit A